MRLLTLTTGNDIIEMPENVDINTEVTLEALLGVADTRIALTMESATKDSSISLGMYLNRNDVLVLKSYLDAFLEATKP